MRILRRWNVKNIHEVTLAPETGLCLERVLVAFVRLDAVRRFSLL